METIFQLRDVNGKDIISFSDKKDFIRNIKGEANKEFSTEVVTVGTVFNFNDSNFKIKAIDIEFDYILNTEGNRLEAANENEFSNAKIRVVIFVKYV